MSASQAGPAPDPLAGLLAHKGFAAPAGAASDAAPALAPASESLPEIGAAARVSAAPPASLMPHDFLAGRRGPSELTKLTPDPPEAAAVPAPKPAAEAAPPGTEVPELGAKSKTPRPDPALRIDASAFPAARGGPRRFPALAAGLALALALGAAGYGYRSGWFVSLLPERAPAPAAESPSESLPAAPSMAVSDPDTQIKQSTGSDRSPGTGQPSVDVVRIEPDGSAVIAGRAQPGIELILLDNGAPIGTVTADAYGEWVFIPASPLPSGAHDFGLVIKEVRGGASVPAAGQAPAEPDAKQGATGPGVPGINEPGTVAGAAAAVPIPPRKPDAGTKLGGTKLGGTKLGGSKHAAGAPSPAFVVQLASVKSRTGARQEWQALRKRFPKLLSPLSLSLDETKLAGGVTVVRLRTGAFPKRGEAAAFCARLAVEDQDCLVVRTAVAVKR